MQKPTIRDLCDRHRTTMCSRKSENIRNDGSYESIEVKSDDDQLVDAMRHKKEDIELENERKRKTSNPRRVRNSTNSCK